MNEIEKFEKEILKLIDLLNECNFKDLIIIENKIKGYFQEIDKILFDLEDEDLLYVEQKRNLIKNMKLKYKMKLDRFEKKDLNKVDKIQESLLRTNTHVIENVQRSQSSMNSMMKSRDMLKKTFHTKLNLQDSLKASHFELKRIQENEYWNYMYTLLAFLFFVFVFIYIFNKRIPILSIIIKLFHLFISILYYFLSFFKPIN